ncbi:uncharacterized protein LOC109857842 [Pseudomyrmex gracilis]|uniref:uncharacterized protein LOC109857842 n=1 Tax=Pseudomyrmex gracilis TaxID=219809 RepID=UPI000995BEFD|nr:uncharacterized protein LOC109857842 [Pseudomyrmex gracilis]
MAYDGKTSALELHIRVNGQNLPANSEKCSANALRLPNDPSWPKIPARRLLNNTNDIIKPPYVVTLTGTPRKGRSVVRTVTCQPAKSSKRCETHVPKRLPSFVDPRFKRRITREEAEKPDESCLATNGKQMSDWNTDVSQEIKELDEAEKEIRNKTARDYALPHEADKDLESDAQPVRETSDYSVKEQCNLETRYCSALQRNERQNPEEDGLSHQQKQEANRLLLMIDEKTRTLPINALNVEPAPSLSALYQPLANYSIQIPVVTYHNVPLQIPSMSAQVRDVRIPCECMKEKREDSVGDVSTLAKEFEDNPLNDSRQHKVRNSDETLARENINSNVSLLNQDTIKDNAIKNQRGSFDSTDNARNNQLNLSVSARPELLTCQVKDERVDTDEIATNTMSEKALPNDLQDSDKVNSKERNEEPRENVRVGLKRRKLNLSKKAKSFLRKKSRLAIADSDYTLVMPGPRVRSKQSYKLCGRSKSGINSRSLTNVQDENTFETLSSIPLETQELLKESYWEYYRGLRRKIALSQKSEVARREKEPQECLPESRTLQQCSVLSCKINTTLRDPTIVDEKKLISVSAANLLRRKRKRALKRTRLLVLKTIAFLGITVSVAVIFLPMMYEYFFEEEHDEDENLSYIELTMCCITSFLQEAFGGIFDTFNTFFLRPVRSHRKF